MPFSDAGNQSLLATQGISDRFFHHIGATQLLRNICGPTVGAGVSMTNGTGLGADPLDLEHSKLILRVGHQHAAHQPPPVAGDRAGPRQRRATGRDRPDPHPHRRRGRPVHPAAARHRHGDDAGDDAGHHRRGAGRRRMDRRAHARLRRARRPRRRLDARAGRGRVRRRRRRDRDPRPRVRHHPPGRDPHADRCRAPRARGDVLPHAGMPAGADRCVARSRRRADAQRRIVAGPARRRRRARPARPARRARAAHAQHEPAGRDPARRAAAGAGDDRVELQPARDRAQRREGPRGHGPRRPVHGRPRAVPHRHRQVRRHRAPGHDPHRVRRRHARLGSSLDGMERGRDRAARRVGQQHRVLPAHRRARWASPSRRCSTTT